MAMWLKKSTAVTIKMGPFLDDVDGKTQETALTISQADIRLSKNGGAYAQTNNAAGATHDEKGNYGIPLDATDTDTVGTLRVHIHESGALPVWQDFMVVATNVWDSFFSTDLLDVNVTQISEDAVAANNLETAFDGGSYNVGGGAVVAASVTGAVGSVTGAVGSVTGAVGSVSAGGITAASIADGAIDAATFAAGAIDAAAVAADAGTEIGTAVWASATRTLTAATNLTALASQASVDTIDDFLDTEIAAIKAKTDNLPASPAATGDIPSANTIADAVLTRGMANVEATAGEHTLCTVVLASLESSRSGTTWTIKRTDGATTHATKTITTDSTANPVTGVS